MSHNGGTRPGVLITGASGYLGRLIAVALLKSEEVTLLLPIRSHHTAESVSDRIACEMQAQGEPMTAAHRSRLNFVPLSESGEYDVLAQHVSQLSVREIIHAAACLDYFDTSKLEAVNIGLTQRLLEYSTRWGIERFVYISTAFSSGYVQHPVAETLHDEPDSDPTEYTRTKRHAERLVAESGIPFLCLRPSVVIGDSQDGHYTGKQYGLYQMWAGIERFLCREWEPELHVVAGPEPMQFVHQDAFQAAFLSAWRKLPANTFLNIVSARDTAPNHQQLWELWMRHCLVPERVRYYSHIDDIPAGKMSRPVRALMALGSINLDIAAHPWRWDSNNLRSLFGDSQSFPPVTLESVWRCQRAFMQSSQRVGVFIDDAVRLRKAEKYRLLKNVLQPVHDGVGVSP